MDALKLMTEGMIKEDKPEIKIGSTVRVSVKIREGERERIQVFEGTVIAKKGSGVSETFTVRRVSYGVGVERVQTECSVRSASWDLQFTIFPMLLKTVFLFSVTIVTKLSVLTFTRQSVLTTL